MTSSGVLTQLYPSMGAWTERALWADVAKFDTPASNLAADIEEIRRHRLAGLATLLASHQPDAFPPSLLGALRAESFLAAARSLEVARAGIVVCAEMQRLGLHPIVIKGPTIAAAWRSPQARPFSDIDIVVTYDEFPTALARLESQDFREQLTTALPWRGMRRICREGTNLVRAPHERIDLHHHVPPWRWAERLTADLIKRPTVPVRFGSLEFPGVGPEVNFVIACLHLVSDRSKPGDTLIIWRDLVELAAASDVGLLVEVIAAAGLGGWVRSAISSFPVKTRLIELFESIPDQPIIHPRRLDIIARRRSRQRKLPVGMLLRLPTWRALLYAAGIALPRPEYLRNRYGSVGGGLKEWWMN